tara:strand:- start:121 stop:1236 length:1116 start_codon:yes stop_codon:yes gene_type:complete
MGSKPSKQSGGSKGGGMSPGQSMAMAGNTGLAGVKEKDAVTLQNAIQNVNRRTGGNQGSSFKDIGQKIGEVGSKYRRPADVANYVKNMSAISDALDKGASVFTGPDGIQRVNFNNLGIKDDQGRTILSRQLPNLNATAPSLGQLGGDMSRALTGYNSLQYTDPSSNVPEMVRSPGMAEGIAKLAVPGSIAAKIATDLFGTAKNFLFPIEEEEEEDIFSSGADATGGAFALAQSLVPKEIEQEELPNRSFLPNAPGGIYEDMSIETQPGEEGPTSLTALRELNTPSNQPGGQGGNQGGNQGGGSENQQPQDPPPNTDPSALELAIRRNLESAGFTLSQIDSILGDLGYQMGGLVPPERGPMSSGVASLFKNK